MLDLKDLNEITKKAWHTDVFTSPAALVLIYPAEIWLEEL